MKPSFHARPCNGPFDDPCLYVRVLREGRAIVFDLGFTTSLSPRDILKTTDIFVSHTHIDHFIGFESILRVSLKKEDPLRLYGPEGFISCIEGKLRGYAWNIITDYPLVIEVIEVYDKGIKKALFKAGHSFIREDLGTEPFSGILLKDTFLTVSSAVLDHDIPCLAFSLEEDFHINIDKAALQGMGLQVGPWLREFKRAVRESRNESVFTVEGRPYTLSDIKGIATITKGQKISYVVDAVGSKENMMKIVDLIRGSDVLYIEAYFLDADRDRAADRYHLTAREAGRIAKEAGVGRLEVIHLSPRYINDPGVLLREAEEEFCR